MTTKLKFASALLVMAFAFGATGWSQEAHTAGKAKSTSAPSWTQSPECYFRLRFRVLDLSPEGKMVNSRSYEEVIVSGIESGHTSSIRTGDRVPVAIGGSSQFQYIDIGTDIDANKAAIVDQALRLHVTANISSMSSTVSPGDSGHPMHEPIIRQTKWDSNVTVPIGKATLIFSSDNSSDKGKTELELTATPISQ